MFTGDPKFRDVAVTTTRRITIRDLCDATMEELGVEENQVVWLPNAGHYVPESKNILAEFLARVQVPEGSVIFSDRGNAFFRDGKPLIPQLCGAQTATYPPEIHHFLSPNDHDFHSSVKAKWRAEEARNGWGKDHSIESSISLLAFMNTIPPEEVRGYFTRNFCMDRSYITGSRCVELIREKVSREADKNGLLARAREAHKKHISQNPS